MQRREPHVDFPFGAPGDPGTSGETPAPRRPRQEPEVLTVGELDRRLKRLLEGSTGDVRVEGEISGLRVVASGHAYFTLKDEREEAAIDCVMYRTAPPRSRRLLADGARVVLAGRASLYAPRGRLQFLADHAMPAGRGALLEALERLKEKLAAEGLFAPERKRPLPQEPRIIGVVTSADGAAIHDIVTVAFRRGGARLLLARTQVQGPGAAQQMVRAIAMLEQVPEVDLIILGRGGGSADDLSAYNDEIVVRKVAAARVPVVSAVGHEIDTSLTDLAADARAATPSQAAEMVVPDAGARREALEHIEARLRRSIAQRLRAGRTELDRRRRELGSPERLLAQPQQQIDDALVRLERAMGRALAERGAELARLDRRLASSHPRAVVAAARAALGPLEVRLVAAAQRALATLRQRFAADVARLDALSPLQVLARGYAIATDAEGRAIREHTDVAPGDRIEVRVHRGALLANVVATAAPGEALPETRGAGGAPPGGALDGRDASASPGRRRALAAPSPPARKRRAPAPAAEQLGLNLGPEGGGADG